MIKEIIGSALCITSMVSCATTAPLTKEENDSIMMNRMYFNKFDMDGHAYILFYHKGDVTFEQLMHDPDCRCMKKVDKPVKANGPVLV